MDDLSVGSVFEEDDKEGEIPEIKPLTEDEVASIVQQEISDALTSRGTTIAEEQSKAIDYYHGRPFGNEIEDRSQVVLTDVRDTIEWIMPTLMQLFFGGNTVIRYVPQNLDAEQWARQATEYAQYLTARGNLGFMVFHDWFKDALLEKLGSVVAFWDSKTRKELERYAELSEEQLAELVAEDGVELVAVEKTTRMQDPPKDEEGNPLPDPQTGMPMQPFPVDEYEAHIRRVSKRETIRIEGIPNEELIVSARTRIVDEDRCPFIGRRKRVTFSDLYDMGIPASVIQNLPSAETSEFEQGSLERREDEGQLPLTAYDRLDWASRETWLVECWIRIDEDGDGYSELRRILCAGDTSVQILEDDEVSHLPVCTLCPVPFPHKLHGLSVADLIMDLQRYRSTILRQMMDNIYLTNNSRYEVVEGEVEIEDLLTTSPGGVVRVTGPGMVKALETPALGVGAFNLLEYLHGVKEDRTGITRYNQGRDASSLNQTATGISAIMEQANLRVQMIARIFGETGVKRLYQQILHVMRENKIKKEVVRLRNEWVEVDPQMWKADLDVEVEIGLGTAQSAIRVDNMMLLHDLQKQVMEFDGRMVSPENVYAVLERVPEAMGFTTKQLFFTRPDPAEEPPAPDPDPKMVEIEARQQIEQQKLQIEMETLQFRREQVMVEAQVRREEMKTRIEVARIQAEATVEQTRVGARGKLIGDAMRDEADLEKEQIKAASQLNKGNGTEE